MRRASLMPIIVAAAIAATVIAVGAGYLMVQARPAAAPPPVEPSPVPSFNPRANDAHHGGGTDREPSWRLVAERFGRNFTNVAGGAELWRSRLAGPGDRYVTGSLAKQLATVDVTNVPGGDYAGVRVIKDATYDLTVEVRYRQGWSLELSLITDGTRWQIYDYGRST